MKLPTDMFLLSGCMPCASAGEGFRYVARFPTRINGRYCTVRLPWALFRAEAEGSPVLEPSAVTHVGLRYELRRTPQAPAVTAAQQQQQPAQQELQPAAAAAAGQQKLFVPEGARLPAGADPAMRARSLQLQQQRAQQAEQRFSRFSIEVDWIKALPAGVEPEFVLVSCAGSATRPGVDVNDLNRIVAAKRKGEDALRASGLGYTIIRPGLLVVSPWVHLQDPVVCSQHLAACSIMICSLWRTAASHQASTDGNAGCAACFCVTMPARAWCGSSLLAD